MQMTNHEVGNLVSAINKPKNQWKIKGKVERMRCSRRQEEKHGKSAKRKFRKPVSQCENFANQFRSAKISQTKFAMRKFRNAKFRNAKVHFAMPIPISQCENFAMRNFAMPKSISQCQFQFRNAKISQCEISQCQSPFRIAKFTAFAKFTLRNFQALSSSVINAEPPSIFGLLLFCPIT